MAYDEDPRRSRPRRHTPATPTSRSGKCSAGWRSCSTGTCSPALSATSSWSCLGYQAAQQALERDHVREMDFTGRPMKNMIFVQPAGLRGPALPNWVTAAADHARSLPPKPPKIPNAPGR